jgi:trigger factor
MQLNKTKLSDTQVQLVISADASDLKPFKEAALRKLSKNIKLAGFRQGKAPLSLVEKNVDQQALQAEFLDKAMTDLYAEAATKKKINPVTRPEVTVKKFVPFTTLEFEVKTHIIGNIKLANYKLIKLAKPEASVTAADVNEVIESLKTRIAEKKEVKRAAKQNDQTWIDFKGIDEKGQPVNGADGKDYPLLLGSNTFIPGFEDNIVGMKQKDKKTFTLTFPKDYGVKALADKKVTFSVSLNKIEEVVKPKLDDDFAAKVGPFKSVKELKEDIEKQLMHERQHEVTRKYHDDLIKKIVDKSSVAIPEPLVRQQVTYLLDDLNKNLTYRGQSYEDYLKSENMSEDDHKNKVLSPQAELQVKTGLILNKIAEAESLEVSPEELEIRIQMLKGQYKDAAMQSELDKPENRQDIASRILTEKVLHKLEQYANSVK